MRINQIVGKNEGKVRVLHESAGCFGPEKKLKAFTRTSKQSNLKARSNIFKRSDGKIKVVIETMPSEKGWTHINPKALTGNEQGKHCQDRIQNKELFWRARDIIFFRQRTWIKLLITILNLLEISNKTSVLTLSLIKNSNEQNRLKQVPKDRTKPTRVILIENW